LSLDSAGKSFAGDSLKEETIKKVVNLLRAE